MIVGIPVYQGVDLLDVAGPLEMFRCVPKGKQRQAVVISAPACQFTWTAQRVSSSVSPVSVRAEPVEALSLSTSRN